MINYGFNECNIVAFILLYACIGWDMYGPKRDTFKIYVAVIVNNFNHCQPNKASVGNPPAAVTDP